jgi:tetratricopeptide (TPR) repeat protein
MTQTIPDKLDEEDTNAHVALRSGDTRAVRQHRDVAGRVLLGEAKSATHSGDKHFLRYLAAKQYYLGGNYQQALKITRRIEKRFIPKRYRDSYEQFERDVNERAKPEYAQNTRNEISRVYKLGDHAGVLELLQQHPFLYTPAVLAYLRAWQLVQLEDTTAAAIFLAQASRLGTPTGELFDMSCSIIEKIKQSGLPHRGLAIDEAVQHFPHFSTYAAAVIVLNQLQFDDSTKEPAHYYRKQLDYSRRCWDSPDYPGAEVPDSIMRDTLSLMAISAARAANILGDSVTAWSAIETAKKLNPLSSNVRELLSHTTNDIQGLGQSVSPDRLSVPSEIQIRLQRRLSTNEHLLKTV